MNRDASVPFTTSIRRSYISVKRRSGKLRGRSRRRGKHNIRLSRNKSSSRERLKGKHNNRSKSKIRLMQSNKRLQRKLILTRRMKKIKMSQSSLSHLLLGPIAFSLLISTRVCLHLEILLTNNQSLKIH